MSLSSPAPKAILLDTDISNDKCNKEYVSPYSALSILWSDIKYGTISGALTVPVLGTFLNRSLQDAASTSGGNRPYRFSCKTNYTSYDSLTDYTYYGRHMEPAPEDYITSLPPVEKVLEFFAREKAENGTEIQTMCIRSTMLFPTFAQHLIDSFIKTETSRDDANGVEFLWDRTSSPHDIGLLPLYGNKIEQTNQLRLKSEVKGKKGLLKYQIINGEVWSPFLYDDELQKKKEFSTLDEPQGFLTATGMQTKEEQEKKKKHIFAFGGARANLIPNISAWNVLLLREHNRIAGEIEKSEPSWDDERVFQTARNTLLAMYLKLVVEEYINHITKYDVDFTVDPGPWMWNAPW